MEAVKMEEIKITDMKQVAYLNMKGIEIKRVIKEGNKKLFYFSNPKLINDLIVEYYNSDISKFLGCYENIKTLVYRT
jgi:hypothetical protein